MTTLFSYLSGTTATIILVTGWIAGLRILAINKRSPSKLLPWAALVLITFGSFYLGTTMSFFQVLMNLPQFDPPYIAAWFCYSISPIVASSCMYLGCSLFKPKIAKVVGIIYFAIGMVYDIFLWFIPDQAVLAISTAGELIDISNVHIGQILMAGMIISLFFWLVGGFVFLSRKASGPQKKVAVYFAWGFGLFTISAIGDALIPATELLLLLIRAFMLTAFVFLFLAASRMSPKPK